MGQRMDTGVLVAYDEVRPEVHELVLVHRHSRGVRRGELLENVAGEDQAGNPSCPGAYRQQVSLSSNLAFHVYRHLRLMVSLA